jgi:hypothetical protein
MSEGLTRRRGAGAGGASGRTSGELERSTNSPAGGSSRPDLARNTSGGTGTGAATTEGGHKVAYDPRDFNDTNETKTNPRLTLMEEVLLLGLKDKAVSRGKAGWRWPRCACCARKTTQLRSRAGLERCCCLSTAFVADSDTPFANIHRATCPSGTTTSRTRSAAAS